MRSKKDTYLQITGGDHFLTNLRGQDPKAAFIHTLSKFGLYNLSSMPVMKIAHCVYQNSISHTIDLAAPTCLMLDHKPYFIVEKSGVYQFTAIFPNTDSHSMSVHAL